MRTRYSDPRPILPPLTSVVARLLDLEQERRRLFAEWKVEELRRVPIVRVEAARGPGVTRGRGKPSWMKDLMG